MSTVVETARFSLLIILCCFVVAPTHAITDEEIFRDLRFNFINPGGRSLGMGGAFIALATDATAAQANPAGLTTLLAPQLFFEIRPARLDGTTTQRQFRDPVLEDDGFDILVQTEPESVTSPSFLSVAGPIRWGGDGNRKEIWVGLSRQEVINVNNRTENELRFLFGNLDDARNGSGSIDLELTHWNVTLGVIPTPRLRIGATLSYGVLALESSIVNTYVDPEGSLISPELAGVPIEMYATRTSGDDTDLTLTGGVLWEAILARLTLGAVWREGGSYSIPETLVARNIDSSLIPGMIASSVFFNESGVFLTQQNNTYTFGNKLNVPDVAGIGAAWRSGRVALTADIVRTSYSNLIRGFNSRLNVLTSGFGSEEEARFTLDDQTNFHFGAEYRLTGTEAPSHLYLRAGIHEDKDSRLRSDFAPGGFGSSSNDNFPGRDDELHYSIGLGVVMAQRDLRIDAALDYSDLGSEGVISMIYEFGSTP